MRATRRRSGPIPAWPSELLGWHATRSLDDIVGSAWRWHTSHPNGYESEDSTARASTVEAAG